jgi:hypothetical protein
LDIDKTSGQPVKMAITFNSFKLTTPEGASEPLPKGAVVTA